MASPQGSAGVWAIIPMTRPYMGGRAELKWPQTQLLKGGKRKMDEQIETKLNNYISLFDVIKERTGNDETARVILQELGKDSRMGKIRDERNGSGPEPATDSQKRYLKKLGVDVPDALTKKEASALIDSALAKKDY